MYYYGAPLCTCACPPPCLCGLVRVKNTGSAAHEGAYVSETARRGSFFNKNTGIFEDCVWRDLQPPRAYLPIKCNALVWRPSAHVPVAVVGIRVHHHTIACTLQPLPFPNAKRRVVYFGRKLQNLHKFTRKTLYH